MLPKALSLTEANLRIHTTGPNAELIGKYYYFNRFFAEQKDLAEDQAEDDLIDQTTIEGLTNDTVSEANELSRNVRKRMNLTLGNDLPREDNVIRSKSHFKKKSVPSGKENRDVKQTTGLLERDKRPYEENSTLSTHSSEYCLISEKAFSYPSSFLPGRRPLQAVNNNDQHGRQHQRTYRSRYFSGSDHSDSPPLPLSVPQDVMLQARSTVVPMVDDVLPALCRQDRKLGMFNKGRASAEMQTRGVFSKINLDAASSFNTSDAADDDEEDNHPMPHRDDVSSRSVCGITKTRPIAIDTGKVSKYFRQSKPAKETKSEESAPKSDDCAASQTPTTDMSPDSSRKRKRDDAEMEENSKEGLWQTQRTKSWY